MTSRVRDVLHHLCDGDRLAARNAVGAADPDAAAQFFRDYVLFSQSEIAEFIEHGIRGYFPPPARMLGAAAFVATTERRSIGTASASLPFGIGPLSNGAARIAAPP